MLRVLGVVYLVAVQLAWLLPSPVGTNISRLGLIFAGVGLVATLPGRDVAEVSRSLREQRILVAARHGRLRVSPHFYNDESDLETLRLALS